MTFRRTRCAHCRQHFEPERQSQIVHVECVEAYVEAQAEKRARVEAKAALMAAKVERAEDRKKREQQKSIKVLLAEAQEPFNEFIRLRDADQPCISCSARNPPMTPGGQWDAGHFLGRGAYPELRFEESNCHKQCKGCNAGSGKFAHKARTVGEDYERNLIQRIGQEAVDWLRGPHELIKWKRDQVLAIKDKYRALASQLKKEREA